MSTMQDIDDLIASSSLPVPRTPRRHHTASPERDDANDDPSGSDRRRQKRRRVEVDLDVDRQQTSPPTDNDTSQPSTSILTQISTWEIPPDVVPVDAPHPTGAEIPQASPFSNRVIPQASPSSNRVLADQSATPLDLSVPIDLSDSDDPTIEFTQTDRISPGSPIVMYDKLASPSRIPPSNAAETAASSISVPEPLSAYTCPICFSPPTNATLTPCGHICCGQCLFTAVKSTIRRSMVVAMERAPVARCPVCRAEIHGWDGRGSGVIGLKMQVMYSL